MRRTLLACAVLLFAACGAEKTPNPASSGTPTVTAQTDSQVPVTVDCVPEDGKPTTCGNLLPVTWKTDTVALHTQLDSLFKYANNAADSVTRDGKVSCQNGGQRKTLGVLLKAPIAMDSFPRAGTGGRELVTSIFKIERDTKCPENRYDVTSFRGNSRNSYEFIVTTSNVASAPNGTDSTIGTWTSYSLNWKKSGTKKDYQLLTLASGRYVQCGHVHPMSDGNVAFISCSAAGRIAEKARGSTSPDSAFRSILANVIRGDKEAIAMTRADPLTDPAWGRCGSVGCCAAEGALTAVDGQAKTTAKD